MGNMIESWDKLQVVEENMEIIHVVLLTTGRSGGQVPFSS